jgi:DNA-binding CsgD family transcriptional regulator
MGKKGGRKRPFRKPKKKTEHLALQRSSGDKVEETLRRLQLAYDQSIIYAEALSEEIKVRKKTEGELGERQAALISQAKHLEEANTALKVLLKHRETDKLELEEKVVSNVKGLIFHHINALRKTRLTAKQQALLDLIESDLINIVSPFLNTLNATFKGLTPREIQIANLVKEGQTTKEIAALINVSTRAVEFHRYNIRIKLGLRNKKANLRSYLLSLS